MRTDQTIKNQYTVTSGVLKYSVTFPLYDATDVGVYLSKDGGNTERKLTLGTDYSVAINSSRTGGTVTLVPGVVSAGDRLVLISEVPYTQELDLTGVSTVDVESTETQLDRDCQQRQQLLEKFGRCLMTDVTSGKGPKDYMQMLEEVYKHMADAGNSIGATLIEASVSYSQPSDNKRTLATWLGVKPNVYDSVAQMKSDGSLKPGMYALTAGFYQPNDGGGATYKVVNSTKLHAETLDNGKMAELIIDNNVLNVRTFGAVGDGLSDDTSSILSAISYIKSIFPTVGNPWEHSSYPYLVLRIPSGNYRITSVVNIPPYITIKGDGINNTIVRFIGKESKFYANNAYWLSISDINMYGDDGNIGLSVYKTARYSIKNCAFRFFETALSLFDSPIGVVENCDIQTCTTGILFDGTGNGVGCHAVNIRDGEIHECTKGILLKKAGNGISFSGVRIEGNSIGIDFEINNQAVGTSIASCYFEGNSIDINGQIGNTNINNNFFTSSNKKGDERYFIKAHSLYRLTFIGNLIGTFEYTKSNGEHVTRSSIELESQDSLFGYCFIVFVNNNSIKGSINQFCKNKLNSPYSTNIVTQEFSSSLQPMLERIYLKNPHVVESIRFNTENGSQIKVNSDGSVETAAEAWGNYKWRHMLRGGGNVPSTRTSEGREGEVAYDSNYLYYCWYNNNWLRVARDRNNDW